MEMNQLKEVEKIRVLERMNRSCSCSNITNVFLNKPKFTHFFSFSILKASAILRIVASSGVYWNEGRNRNSFSFS